MTPADIAEMRRRIAQGDPIGLVINAARLLELLDELDGWRHETCGVERGRGNG